LQSADEVNGIERVAILEEESMAVQMGCGQSEGGNAICRRVMLVDDHSAAVCDMSHNRFGHEAGHDSYIFDASAGQCAKLTIEHRETVYRQQALGRLLGQGAQARSAPSRQQHGALGHLSLRQ
jgi:hypothetical protein